MPKPGTINNPKGRTVGSINLVNKEIKERFKDFVDGNFDKVQDAFDKVFKENPAKGLELYLAFSERILGRVSSSSIDLTSDGKALKSPIINVYPTNPD